MIDDMENEHLRFLNLTNITLGVQNDEHTNRSTTFDRSFYNENMEYDNEVNFGIAATETPTVTVQPFANELSKNEALSNLLKSWDLSNLFDSLKENEIDVQALKMMEREDVKILLKNESLGTKIKFNHNLKQWLNQQGIQTNEHTCCASQDIEDYSMAQDDAKPQQLYNYTRKNKVHLKDILSTTVPGISLLNIAKNKLSLSDDNRYILVDTIVSHFINNSIHMGVNECALLAEDIANEFEGEISSVYFRRRPNKGNKIGLKGKGQLYDRYNNRIYNLRKSNLVPRAKRFKSDKAEIPENCSNVTDINIDVKEAQTICVELKFNRDDSKLDIILHKWNASRAYRNKWISQNNDRNISAIIQEWPAYEQTYGPKLLDIDFIFMYPNAENIFLKFELFSKNIITIMDKKIVDQTSKQILKEFKQQKHTTPDARFTIVLLLLHVIIKPTTRRMDMLSKKMIKYTIMDSQMSFMVLCKSSQDVDQFLYNRNQLKLVQKKNMQPCIFIVGTSWYSENQYFVICDNIKYKCVSMLSALDCAFKQFSVFNLEYPEESKATWQFIQQYFYKIKTKFDDAFPAVDLLISKLEKQHTNMN